MSTGPEAARSDFALLGIIALSLGVSATVLAALLGLLLGGIRVSAAVHRWSIILLLAVTLAFAAPVARAASLIGTYDGGQMEIAAGLELKADGRFRYALSYGALDEEAAGRWTTSGDRVFLTSDLVTPPRFVLVTRYRGQTVCSRSASMSRRVCHDNILTP